MKQVLIALVLLFPTLSVAEDSRRYAEIKSAFSQWQAILHDRPGGVFVIHRYATGEHLEKLIWLRKETDARGHALVDTFTLFQRDIGFYLRREQYALSTDWVITSEHYYDKKGHLYFVFWHMNTFLADEPATVERRLYFSADGKVIRHLEEIYKLGTRQKQKVSFMNRKVEYATEIKSLAFYDQLPK